jgi:hypothetical protein
VVKPHTSGAKPWASLRKPYLRESGWSLEGCLRFSSPAEVTRLPEEKASSDILHNWIRNTAIVIGGRCIMCKRGTYVPGSTLSNTSPINASHSKPFLLSSPHLGVDFSLTCFWSQGIRSIDSDSPENPLLINLFLRRFFVLR